MKVVISNCNKYDVDLIYRIIGKGLSLINFDLKKGMKVLIKPNILSNKDPKKAVTTNPLFLDALIKILKEKNCKIVIGDSPGGGNIKEAFEISGIKEIADKNKVDLICFDTTPLIKFKKDSNKIVKEIYLPSLINEFDLIINLPKLKTHSFTLYTGAVKNLFGFIPGGKKANFHKIASNVKNFSEILLDIHEFVKPHLVIMDAIIGMEGDGPLNGDPKETNLILMSENSLALDFVASRIIGFDFKDIGILDSALKRNLLDPDKIEILGKETIVNYKKPIFLTSKLPYFVRKLIPDKYVLIDKKKCKKCMICFNHCPVNTIKLKGTKNNSYLKIYQKNCIKCYCCHELCSHNSVILKKPALLRLIQFIVNIVKKFKGVFILF